MGAVLRELNLLLSLVLRLHLVTSTSQPKLLFFLSLELNLNTGQRAVTTMTGVPEIC